jgi:YD repeat-containing protein
MTDPDMGSWSYTYDLNGNLHQQTDAKGQVITFDYDELDRVETKSYSTSDPTVIYTYDLAVNGIGRIYSVTNTDVTTTYDEYDGMGRVKSVTKTISGDQARTTAYEYDFSGKLTRTTYPDTYYVENDYYQGTNLLDTVTGSDSEEYAEITSYSPSGKIKTLSHGNGSSTTYTYDARSEKLYQILTKNGSAATIQKKRYFYTSIGEISSINDLHNGVTYSYTYDALSRLKTETNNGSYDSISINYNSIGNITSKSIGSNSFTYYADSTHKHAVDYIRYNGQNYQYSYDANGNMTYGPDFTNLSSIKTRTISYNADNMPTEIVHSSGVTTNLLYGGMGTRVRKSVYNGSSTTYTYYIGDHFEIEGGTFVKYIFAGNLRVA